MRISKVGPGQYRPLHNGLQRHSAIAWVPILCSAVLAIRISKGVSVQHRLSAFTSSDSIMLEYSVKPRQMTGREYTTVGALKYRPSLHLPVSTNKDLLTTSLCKRDASGHSSNGGTLNSSNCSSTMDNCHPPEIHPMTLTVSTSECAPPALTFPLSRETSISMNLCGQVVTYDLKSLGQNPQIIIELLKATKSECATWMIVSAFYRRRGEPRSGISVMKSFIEGEKVFITPP